MISMTYKELSKRILLNVKRAAEEINIMINGEIVSLKNGLQLLVLFRLFPHFVKKHSRIQEETMESIVNKMPDLTEREKKVLNKHTKSIINQLLKEPILAS